MAKLFPDDDLALGAYRAGNSTLLWTTLPVDTETPVSALMKLLPLSEYHLLFESVAGGKRARYSIVALDPDALWKCEKGTAYVSYAETQGQGIPRKFRGDGTDVFASLRRFYNAATLEIPKELPPMAAGIFGYMGHDMVRHIERLPDKNPDTIGIADAVYMRPRIVIIFDSTRDEASIITPLWYRPEVTAEEAYKQGRARIDMIVKQLKTAPAKLPRATGNEVIGPFCPHINDKDYAAIVRRAVEYVHAGDVCQVVPSRRWEGPFKAHPLQLYRSLRQLNPSPYLFYMTLGTFSLVGSSPEILVRLEAGKVTVRPIAGTRPRGKTEQEDTALERELLADEKEVSEHLMLLDLGRNDVGKVSRVGTVTVTERMVVERYSHVMHIVSNVEGELREDADMFDTLMAGFPAGTLTGAPKVRAMEIIDELEIERRSYYGGTVGYFSSGGVMDTCIAIRTGLVKDGILYLQAGGGIVADSVEDDEIKETENKARAVLRAAETAGTFL